MEIYLVYLKKIAFEIIFSEIEFPVDSSFDFGS